MPRPSKGARLYFSEADGYWYIRDGQRKRSTGCTQDDRAGAEKALSAFLADKHEPNFGVGNPDTVSVLDVLLLYARERGPKTARPEMVSSAVVPLGVYWQGKKVGQISPSTCDGYVTWRTAQPQARYKDPKKAPRVGVQTARRELETLQAAIGYAFQERKLKFLVPVSLPDKSEPRDRWLTRSEVARLLWSALGFRVVEKRPDGRDVWRRSRKDQAEKGRHIARFILLGLYSGTRYKAMLRLRWLPSTDAGWADLDRAIIYRKGKGEVQTSKRRTPVPISDRLLTHMTRWRQSSTTHVVEYAGRPIGDNIKRTWRTTRIRAGLGEDVTPHILRHTFATWAVQDGQPLGKVAAALGTTEAMVQRVYGHHAPERLRDVVNAVSGGISGGRGKGSTQRRA